MFNMKKAMAVAMTVALMVPSTAFAATSSPVKTSIAGQKYTISSQYTGKDETLKITVNGKELVEGTDFVLVGSEPTALGSYTLTIKGIGLYDGEATIAYTIAKAEKPVYKLNKKTEKKLAKGFKAKKLKKKSKKIKLKVKSEGKVKSFKVKGKKAKKWVKVSKKGVVTLMKGIKKGTYKIRVKIKGTDNFAKGYRTIKIVVK
ncbi:hypothetical protein BN3660_00247 [Eubacteriaceae bacterium CHKCI004]|nr:hypothetical protein BN3660_00247 [Eubacteriaceae bacterium CHKCI004]